MTAMQPRDNLTIKAAALARQSPELWAEFVEAFAVVTKLHQDNLLRSPLEVLQVTQGRAQMSNELCRALTEAVSNADKIKNGINNVRP